MTSNRPDVSARLAHTYGTWQMYALGHELEVLKLASMNMATIDDCRTARRGDLLARAILDHQVKELNTAEWTVNSKFVQPEMVISSQLSQSYGSFPYEIFSWNRTSRRVFHLPHSLEVMLASATFPDMEWADLLWPFESFIVSLEKPLSVKHPIGEYWERFDTIMVTKTLDKDGQGFTVNLRWIQVPPRSGVRVGFSVPGLRRFRELVKRRNMPEAVRIFFSVAKQTQKFYPYMFGSQHAEFSVRPGKFDRLITEPKELYEKFENCQRGAWESQPESTVSYYECLSVSLRIAAGWMCYLENLSTSSVSWSPSAVRKTQMMVGGVPNIIIEPERICDIVGEGRINPAEVTSEPARRGGKGFVRPHWRRAHYKRPRGSSPDSPKSIRIPPVLVRADLVQLYGIIGGTRTVVISEE